MVENNIPIRPVIHMERRFAYEEKVEGFFAKKDASQIADKELNIDLTLNTGITLITGDNGSGKTSVIKAIDPLKQLNYYTGRVHYQDYDGSELDFRRDFGKICNRFVAVYSNLEDNHWPPEMTISEILTMFNDLKVNYDKAQLNRWLGEFHLKTEKPLDQFSRGEQQMICLFLALVRKPDVLLLDEVGSFLSLINRPKIYTILKDYLSEEDESVMRAIIITSNHPLEEERLLGLDFVVVLEELEVRADVSTDYLNEKYRGENLEKAISEILEKGCLRDEWVIER